MFYNRLPWIVALLLGGFESDCSARASIVGLGLFNGDATYPRSINNSGQIVGFSSHEGNPAMAGDALLWDNGHATSLESVASAWSINNFGVIVGSRYNGQSFEPFIWTNGNALGLGVTNGSAADVNDAAQVVGSTRVDGFTQAFRWDAGNLTFMDFAFGMSFASGINNEGVVAGSRTYLSDGRTEGFVWSGDTVTPLSGFDGLGTAANAINNQGQVVGHARTNDTFPALSDAVLWNDGEITTIVHTPNGSSSALNINGSGEVVGYFRTDSPSQVSSAFYWHDGMFINLNDLLPPDSGWHLIYAYDINDLGQIVGSGIHNGSYEAFEMTIPEPTSSCYFSLAC